MAKALFTVDIAPAELPAEGDVEVVRLAVGSREMLYVERKARLTLTQILHPQTGVSFAALYRAAYALLTRDRQLPEGTTLAQFEEAWTISLATDGPVKPSDLIGMLGGPGESEDDEADPTTPTA